MKTFHNLKVLESRQKQKILIKIINFTLTHIKAENSSVKNKKEEFYFKYNKIR